MYVMCVIQNFLTLPCKHMNMKRFDADVSCKKVKLNAKVSSTGHKNKKNQKSIDSPQYSQYYTYQITIKILDVVP